MARAAWINLRSGQKRQGASTLTQQLARSGLLGIGREQTWSRKFNEILYALLMEARYDKGTILVSGTAGMKAEPICRRHAISPT